MKNDYGHSHLPLADQGAIDALKGADKQGFIEEFPEKKKEDNSQYGITIKNIYDYVRKNGKTELIVNLICLLKDAGCEDLAFHAEEGMRDFEKDRRNGNREVFSVELTYGHGKKNNYNFNHKYLLSLDHPVSTNEVNYLRNIRGSSFSNFDNCFEFTEKLREYKIGNAFLWAKTCEGSSFWSKFSCGDSNDYDRLRAEFILKRLIIIANHILDSDEMF